MANGKYAALTDHLRGQSHLQMTTLSFGELKRILGFSLPFSAGKHRAWWSDAGHAHTRGWRDAGFSVEDVNLTQGAVRFARKPGVLKGGSKGHIESPVPVPLAREQESRAEVARRLKRPEKSTVRLGKYDFQYICAIDPEREADGSLREFIPQARYDNATGLPLNRYGDGPFCKFKIPRNMEFSGVYALVVNGEARYIGECVGLSSRYNMGYGNISPRNCFVGGQETNCRINNLVLQQIKAGSDVSLWFLATDEYKLVERELRESLPLSWNRV